MIYAIFELFFLVNCFGVDALIGYDTDEPVSSTLFDCLNNSGYSFFIARVQRSTGKIDTVGIQSLVKAQDFELTDIEGYLFPCPKTTCPSPTQQVNNVDKALSDAGVNITVLWIDVEEFKNGWPTSQSSNRKFVTEMVNAADNLGYNVGIYSNYNNWQTLVGVKFDQLSAYPLWWARYNGEPNLVTGWVPFGGWDSPTTHQYTQNSVVCGLKLDKNYKNDANFKQASKLQKFKLPQK